jgi:hypothetical protein
MTDHAAAFMLNDPATFGAGATFLFGSLCVKIITVFKHVGLNCLCYGVGAGKYPVLSVAGGAVA